jgi:Family of unknown function (DUF5317)
VLIAALALIIAIVVPILGGRITNLGRLQLRQMWLIAIALVVQIVILGVFDDAPETFLKAIHLATYAAIVAFLFANRSVPWMWVVTIGTFCNLIVIAANGGVMPSSRAAREAAGLNTKDGFSNSQVVDNPRLSFLGDIFATPDWLPLANVFSVGDVILLVGLIPLIITVSRIPEDRAEPFLRPVDETSPSA